VLESLFRPSDYLRSQRVANLAKVRGRVVMRRKLRELQRRR